MMIRIDHRIDGQECSAHANAKICNLCGQPMLDGQRLYTDDFGDGTTKVHGDCGDARHTRPLCTCRLEGKATDWRDNKCPLHGSETWDWSTQVPPNVDAMIRVDGGDTFGRFGRTP